MKLLLRLLHLVSICKIGQSRTRRRWRLSGFYLAYFFSGVMIFQNLSLFESASADRFSEPLEGLSKVEASHVVRFRVTNKMSQAADQTLELALDTRAGFKIYNHGLEFHLRSLSGSSTRLQFDSNPPPLRAFDQWYQEERETHANGAIFKLRGTFSDSDVLRIRFEACSVNTCLLPVWFEIIPLIGEQSVQAERAARNTLVPNSGLQEDSERVQQSRVGPRDEMQGGFVADLPSLAADSPVSREPAEALNPQPTAQPLQTESLAFKPVGRAASMTDSVTLFVQESLLQKSIWLFPALFLAGLLMNLTPCVYPMIPITLNVLGRLGQSGPDKQGRDHWKEGIFRAAIYVVGIATTYSLMGIVAGMTGTLFGSLLQSQFVLLGLSGLFVVLALGMLGIVDFTRVQVWASRIPISEKSPHLGVFTMGAVSGLVSAPCTGPVLSAILLLIGKSQDPIYGLALMSFFSLGFGFPYLFLGLFAHNLKRLPRAGNLLEFVKVFFASLLFGLSLYYLKPVLSRTEQVEPFFSAPSLMTVVGALVLSVLFWFASRHKHSAEKQRNARLAPHKVALVGFVLCATALSMWLSLYVTNGFTAGNVGLRPGTVPAVTGGVVWTQDWQQAVAAASAQNKGIVADAWAEWCAACLKMDKELWAKPEVAQLLEPEFVMVKLDFTESSPFTDGIAEKWDLSGLPAVAIFPAGSDFNQPPKILFRQEVRFEELKNALVEVKKN